MIKSIFNTGKTFRAHSVFQGKHKLLKYPECKNYIQYSEHFQGKRKLLKNRERWKNFQYNVYSLGGDLCYLG